jgi:hypothetical protein
MGTLSRIEIWLLGNNILEITKCCYSLFRRKSRWLWLFQKYDKKYNRNKTYVCFTDVRGMGFGTNNITWIRSLGTDLGYSFLFWKLIQTKEALLISKTGYIVENYEPYVGLENSICMRKQI